MRRWLPAIILLCLIAATVLYLTHRSHQSYPSDKSDQSDPSDRQRLPSNQQRPSLSPSTLDTRPAVQESITSITPPLISSTSLPAAALEPLEPGSTNLPPATVLENVRMAVREYGLRFGGNPVGINSEITRALDGDNPKQVKFLRPNAGMRINANGELVDPWRTPFFFHQLSGSETEIRSAGPDKVMWTADDLVIK